MQERGFLIFLIFFLLLFSEFSCRGRSWTKFGTKIFFSFSRPIQTPFGLKFYPLFLGLSHPVMTTNNIGKRFFYFLNFFAIFFRNFHARVDYEKNLGVKFFSLFLGLSNLVLAKNKARKRFLNFWIFLLFFFRIFFPGLSKNGIWF